MRRPRSPRRGLVAAAVAMTVLAGCGQGADDGEGASPEQGQASERSDSPSLSPSATEDASPSRDPLADAVESQATRVPKGVTLRDPTYGSDISWPQCDEGVGPIPDRQGLGMPMPLPEWRFVIIGLTNGPAMTRNPCLADQLTWARDNNVPLSAYAVATFPSSDQLEEHGDDGPFDGDTDGGRLANWGYAQGEFNLETLREARLDVPGLWIDVEPVPSPPLTAWSDDTAANAEVVRGVARSYRESGMRVGVYSTPNLWDTVVGDLQLGVPEWRAAGETSEAEAVSRCGGESIQGGEAVVGQWVEDRRDRNITCPGRAMDLARWLVRP